jgi:hypothetical protein
MESKSDITKRRGCIRISKELIDNLDLGFFKLLFGSFYPINTEIIGFGDIMYYGYSEHFDISKEGESIRYEAIFTGVSADIFDVTSVHPSDEIKYTIEFSKI